MNRSLTNVLFGGIGTAVSQENRKMEGTITQTTVDDTVEALTNADSVILVRVIIVVKSLHAKPGYLGCGVRHGCCEGSIRNLRDLFHAPS